MATADKQYTHTAYDDAFRTIEEKCDDALLHFINHMFHENYDRTAVVSRLRNEHYIEHEGEINEKRITDSHLNITCRGESKCYQIECESEGYSGTLLVRLFQYSVQTAIDKSTHDHDRIVLEIPYSGLLVLRKRGNPPDSVTFELRTPGGKMEYEAPVICEADYTLEEIFDRKLYFLIPFYIFNIEDRLDAFESGEADMRELQDLLCEIIERLRTTDEAELSLRSKGVIIKQMECVTRKLAEGKSAVGGKVGDIMGGQVVRMEWLERFDAAVSKGRAEGRAEGEECNLIRLVCRKLRKGKKAEEIAKDLDEDETRISAICETASKYAPDYNEEDVIKASGIYETA